MNKDGPIVTDFNDKAMMLINAIAGQSISLRASSPKGANTPAVRELIMEMFIKVQQLEQELMDLAYPLGN